MTEDRKQMAEDRCGKSDCMDSSFLQLPLSDVLLFPGGSNCHFAISRKKTRNVNGV
jgi:hypothetical protein